MNEKTCKVFTPTDVVNEMLDLIGYTSDLINKKILENSCGTGNFLCEIVSRYIEDAKNHHLTDKEIKTGLRRDVYGIEKEASVLRQCLDNLDAVAERYGLTGIRWNVTCEDALSLSYHDKFEYVVGNPPYISYSNLDISTRKRIRDEFETCKEGKADYYYAFVESALNALTADGKMAYLIPNNFMKTASAEKLREVLLPYIIELHDYRFEKLFCDKLTSSAIILCSKGKNKREFKYIDKENKKECLVAKESLTGKWLIEGEYSDVNKTTRFGDCFKVSAPVATLLNKAFIIEDYEEKEASVFVKGLALEKEGLRVATSPKTKRKGRNNYIIFPYYYEDGKLCRYTDDEFGHRFPQIKKHLQKYRNQLKERKTDDNCKWFEYGRSQALAHMQQEKLMLSIFISEKVHCYRLDENTIPYAGIYIVPKDGHTLEQAEQILKSKEFYGYISSIGIQSNGNTYRITPSDISEYCY